MQRKIIFLCVCFMAATLVFAGTIAFAVETQKKTTIDPRTLRLPSRPGTSGTQQTPEPTVKNPEVVSVEVLPPMTDCRMGWQMTLRNSNDTPFTKPITVRVLQKKGTKSYRAVDGVVSPASIPPGQTAKAEGKFSKPEDYTDYRLEVVIDNQVASSRTGPLPKFGHNLAIGGFRFEGTKCYVTIINNNPHQDCGLVLTSNLATSANPNTWQQALAFSKDMPPGGSVEQGFVLPPGYNVIKIGVQRGSSVLAEKTAPIP
jgi:hypothetical protein